jgi:hypothetical protein
MVALHVTVREIKNPNSFKDERGFPWCHLDFPATLSETPNEPERSNQVRRRDAAIPCAVVTVALSGADYFSVPSSRVETAPRGR